MLPGHAVAQREFTPVSSDLSGPMTGILRTQARIAVITIAAWAGIALLFYCQRAYLAAAAYRTPVRDRLFLEISIVWGSWALLTGLVLYTVRRIPLGGERQWLVLLHIPFGIGVALLHSALVAAITPLFLWRPAFAPMRDMFRGRIASAIAFDTVVYLLVAAVLYAIVYAARSRQREVAVAHAEAGLARAQLSVLQTRLQPHFLFNALNSVLALVHEDPARADLMIRRLSDLLRYSLSRSEVQEVSLQEELDVVRGYLEIQKIRFDERLTYQFDIASEALNASIPTFLLQPLVENAVKYSMTDEARSATIGISARTHGDILELAIRDDGPGMPLDPSRNTEGTGIATTRARLEQLFGTRHRLQFSSFSGRGLTVSIDIPLRSAVLVAT
ncbi:MAG TPA: histidine kinase [Gemmatimonadaceae bacterium]|nr:histidine kinase [Gemmatimonadaceae bacterium]